MRSFRVVPEEPGNQLAIELILSDQQFLVIVNEFFLDRTVKPLRVGVHLRRFEDRCAMTRCFGLIIERRGVVRTLLTFRGLCC